MENQKPYEVTVKETTPAMLLNLAINQGADLDRLEKLMMLQTNWEDHQARKAYTVAMSAFKAEKLIVKKDKLNIQYKSKYSSEDSLLNTINPILSKYGLSASFEFDQTTGIKVTCIMTHSAGHREQVSLSGPPDASGSKNPLQQIKSTVTYLRKATFEAITGIASSDDSGDDNGNAGGGTQYITEAQISTILDFINSKGIDTAKFLQYMNTETIELIPATDFNKAVASLKIAKGKAMA